MTSKLCSRNLSGAREMKLLNSKLLNEEISLYPLQVRNNWHHGNAMLHKIV